MERHDSRYGSRQWPRAYPPAVTSRNQALLMADIGRRPHGPVLANQVSTPALFDLIETAAAKAGLLGHFLNESTSADEEHVPS